MVWLTRAVAAGEADVEDWKTDADLDALRNRDDFRTLVKELESKAKPKEPPSTRSR